MKRVFCDICGDEVTTENDLSGSKKDANKLGVEVDWASFEISVFSVRMDSDYCRNCVIESFEKLKTRDSHASDR